MSRMLFATIVHMRVLVFGDSIAQGFWDTEGGWVARLIREYLTLKGLNLNTSQPDLFNLAVDGDTTDKIVYRFHAETMARQWRAKNTRAYLLRGQTMLS